jgi:prophage regulatory protein
MNDQPPQNQIVFVLPEKRIVRMAEVVKRTGIHRATIYRMMARGDFPQSKAVGKRIVCWDSDDIDAWVAKHLGKTESV